MPATRILRIFWGAWTRFDQKCPTIQLVEEVCLTPQAVCDKVLPQGKDVPRKRPVAEGENEQLLKILDVLRAEPGACVLRREQWGDDDLAAGLEDGRLRNLLDR